MSQKTGLTRALLIRRALEEFLARTEAQGQVVFEAPPPASLTDPARTGCAYPAASRSVAMLNETGPAASAPDPASPPWPARPQTPVRLRSRKAAPPTADAAAPEHGART